MNMKWQISYKIDQNGWVDLPIFIATDTGANLLLEQMRKDFSYTSDGKVGIRCFPVKWKLTEAL